MIFRDEAKNRVFSMSVKLSKASFQGAGVTSVLQVAPFWLPLCKGDS
jgi:hypothetical protein